MCVSASRMNIDRDVSETPNSQKKSNFDTTIWSVILKAGAASDDAQPAFERLCRQYWYPLYVFVRRRGYGKEDAEDSTQTFFQKLLSSSSLESVHPEKGKFRTFLIAAMKHYLANEWKASQRLKRGGGKEILSWDELQAEERYANEPAVQGAEDEVFDKQWAQTLVSRALQQLQDEHEREGTLDRFSTLAGFLQGDGAGMSYAEASTQLQLSESAVKSAIFRMRRRYGAIIREEVANTVGDEAEVDAEIDYLIGVLASA